MEPFKDRRERTSDANLTTHLELRGICRQGVDAIATALAAAADQGRRAERARVVRLIENADTETVTLHDVGA
jgi:hypothetical protein